MGLKRRGLWGVSGGGQRVGHFKKQNYYINNISLIRKQILKKKCTKKHLFIFFCGLLHNYIPMFLILGSYCFFYVSGDFLCSGPSIEMCFRHKVVKKTDPKIVLLKCCLI